MSAFQCSSASRKFLNFLLRGFYRFLIRVSVLFSEPKIPQFNVAGVNYRTFSPSFSALQRAENSSMLRGVLTYRYPRGFSALQRAENSSIDILLLGS